MAGWKCKKKKIRSKQLFFPSFFPFLFSISSRRPFKPHPSIQSHLAPPPRMSDDVCARATQRLLIFCRNVPAKPAPDWDAEKKSFRSLAEVMEVDLWLYPSRPHLLRPAPPGDDGLPTAAVSSPEDDAVRRSPTRQHHFILMRASAERPPRTGQSQSASHSRGDAVAVAVAAAAAARPWSFSPSPADSSTSAPRFRIPPCRRVPLARKPQLSRPAC